MTTIPCIQCDREIFLEGVTQLGQRVTCLNCGAEMEVISADPLELDWPQDEDSEEWDDENGYDGFADDFPDLEEGDLDEDDEDQEDEMEEIDEDEDDDDDDDFDEDEFSSLSDDTADDDPLEARFVYDGLDLDPEAVEYDDDDDDDLWT